MNARRLSAIVALFVLALASAGASRAEPPAAATDDPAGETASPFAADAAPGRRADRQARNLSYVGSIRLSGAGGISRVSTLGSLAFVGTHSSGCPRSGVHVVDFADPAVPIELATTIAYPNLTAIDPEAIRIGARSILAVGLSACGLGPARKGLELYDVTEPAQPRLLAFLPTLVGIVGLDLTATPDGRTLALLAAPGLETAVPGPPRTGDLLIVDISDPEHPVQIGEWGLLDEPSLGARILLGDLPDSTAIDVNAGGQGTRAYVSYGDAGTIILDISDPSEPRYLGRTAFAADEEGGAHGAAESRGGNLLVQTNLDQQPFHITFTSSAFPGERPALEAAFAGRVWSLPEHRLAGDVAVVGRGCPAGAVSPGSPPDHYLADPVGKIALIERGGCRYDNKIARAQLAGAIGVIVYDTAPGDTPLAMAGVAAPTLPDGTTVALAIPAVGASHTTGLLLRDGAPPITANLEAKFNGWGYTRIYDIRDPQRPLELSTYETATSRDPDAALSAIRTTTTVTVRGNTAYVAWWNDGLRLLDLSQPAAPREIGVWTGVGAPTDAPPVAALGIALAGDLVLVADRNYGLYILKQAP